jgi:hypothetical protein
MLVGTAGNVPLPVAAEAQERTGAAHECEGDVADRTTSPGFAGDICKLNTAIGTPIDFVAIEGQPRDNLRHGMANPRNEPKTASNGLTPKSNSLPRETAPAQHTHTAPLALAMRRERRTNR